MNSLIHFSKLEDLREIVHQGWSFPEDSYNEVYPGILLGDSRIAEDIEALQSLGVTHVLNAAMGEDTRRYVNTSESFYSTRNLNIKFLGLSAMDLTAYQLHPYFQQAAAFIDDAVTQTVHGKILVHCLQGLSRSATLVVAYLMITTKFSAVEAIKIVRSKRRVYPNDGFLQQLCDLDTRMGSLE